MKARIQGVSAQMVQFDFFFDISLGLLILRHTDNLSKTMQKADMSAAAGQVLTAMTLSTLKSLRNDASFELFWKKITTSAEGLDVKPSALPRRRKTPHRFDNGSISTFHVTVEDHYRVIYFEALDLITSCIEDRFNQPGYKTYEKVQHSSSRLQLQNRMKRSCNSFSRFMVLILTPYFSQHTWNFFLRIFQLMEKCLCLISSNFFQAAPQPSWS